ncbi:MAG: hypothetical protein IH590_09980 [Aquamicrobium sp.]|nr:hypothetical protein [Aquamicrobium sp.]
MIEVASGAVSDNGAFIFIGNIADGTALEIAVATRSVVRIHCASKSPNGITYQL